MPSERLAGAELNPLLASLRKGEVDRASPCEGGGWWGSPGKWKVGGSRPVLASPLARLDAIYTHRVQGIGVGTEGGSELDRPPLAPSRREGE
jgi:hypothetical protein